MNRLSPTRRYATATVVVLFTLSGAACGRVAPEAAGTTKTGAENPFDAENPAGTTDIAGVVVTSDGTVLPPADGDSGASTAPATPSAIDDDAAPGDPAPGDPAPGDPAPGDRAPGDATPDDASPGRPSANNAPPAAPITPEPVQKDNPVVPDGGNRHSVTLGESLSTIAAKYGITTQSLKDFNGLDSNNITEGQTLRIPRR